MNTAMCSEVIVKAVPSFGDVNGADFGFSVQNGTLIQGMMSACKEAIVSAKEVNSMQTLLLRCFSSAEGTFTVEFLDELQADSTFAMLPL
jgi:hypothetical protein